MCAHVHVCACVCACMCRVCKDVCACVCMCSICKDVCVCAEYVKVWLPGCACVWRPGINIRYHPQSLFTIFLTFILFEIACVSVCLSICGYVHMNAGAPVGQTH